MVSFSTLAPCVSVLLNFAAVWATPVNITAYEGLSLEARDILARATPSAPHWIIYSDEYTSGLTGPPAPSAVSVNHFLSPPYLELTFARGSMSCGF